MSRGCVIIILLCCALLVKAQDTHYSQFYASPQNLNPAMAGMFNGDYRIVANQRNQWQIIPVAYNTFSLGADAKLNFRNKLYGAGLQLNYDQAGDSKFTTVQVLATFSKIIKLNKDSTIHLSVGAQPGFTTKYIDYSKLTFDEQYNGDRYDPSSSTGENFTDGRITYPEIAVGGALQYNVNSKLSLNVGFGGWHLTLPKQSFFKNNNKLDLRFTTFVGAAYAVNPRFSLRPMLALNQQGKLNETILGNNFVFALKPVDGYPTAFYTGLFYRNKDAVYMVAGMEYKQFNAGISYDVNSSSLRPASKYRGAIELSIIYIFKKVIPFVPPKKYCPVYI